MSDALHWIDGGGVTSPSGWRAGASYAGIRSYGSEPRFDVGLLASDSPCVAAGVFTQNSIVGAPVTLSRAHLENGVAQAVMVNAGISNVAMGANGEEAARRMAEIGAAKAGIRPEDVLVGSTGVIGRPLPLDRIESGTADLTLAEDGGYEFSRAIMTTDTVEKQRAARVTVDGVTYTAGGAAKGSGMIHPDMATCFCFMTTDAPVERAWLQRTLKSVADVSINMVDIDMDTSTSDTMLLLANGAAGGDPVADGHPAAAALHALIEAVAVELARALARDGEGARTLIEATVEGAASVADARAAARTIVSSPLVKTMVTGKDANLGRVLMAIGRSGAALDPGAVSVWIGPHRAFEHGAPTELDLELTSQAMDADEVSIRVDLGRGAERATAWGCDLTEGYVRINANYTT